MSAPVDVMEVMDMSVAKAKDCAAMNRRSAGLRDDVREAEEARAAVAELIDANMAAILASRLTQDEQHNQQVVVPPAEWKAILAAVARAKGGTA